MATVSADQWDFLVRHNIDSSELFDASGYSRAEYMEIMSRLNLLIAYGVPRCRYGHTLKTRKGHCPQCRPENLSYLRRHNKRARVYVATSEQAGLVKIGSGVDPTARVTELRYLTYGDASDWDLRFSLSCTRAGRAELDVHRRLQQYRAPGLYYVKDGIVRECRELFGCDPVLAIQTVSAVIAEVDNW